MRLPSVRPSPPTPLPIWERGVKPLIEGTGWVSSFTHELLSRRQRVSAAFIAAPAAVMSIAGFGSFNPTL